MTVSLLSVAPEATTASGTALTPEPAKLTLFARSHDLGLQALARAARTDFPEWVHHVRAAADCARPVRLSGTTTTVETATGRVLSTTDTATLPDGAIYKRCGNRRAGVCPSCSKIYQRDAYQIVRAGIAGGKGIPDSVRRHPSMFSTFTAPSFGTVHNRVVKKHTCDSRGRCDCRADPCHARRGMPTCEHGTPAFCFARHEETDSRIGKPLCLDCYDYDAHVVWNKFAGELWRRTKQAIDRELAKTCTAKGIDPVLAGFTGAGKPIFKAAAKTSCGKAAEFQARAAVHFHALIRLDGRDAEDPAAIATPPRGLTAEDLEHAIATAAARTSFCTPAHPRNPAGWLIAWGTQQDNKTVSLSADGEVTDSHVAGYIAKYATKSTEATGHTSARITDATVDHYADLSGSHIKRLIAACWDLGRPAVSVTRRAVLRKAITTPGYLGTTAPSAGAAKPRRCAKCGHRRTSTRCRVCDAPRYRKAHQARQRLLLMLLTNQVQAPDSEPNPYEGLRRWAHMLGFGGHFFSQSPYYSVRFRILREARITFRRNETTAPKPATTDAQQASDDTTVVIRSFAFAGTGWHTTADAMLATTSAALAREHQTRARQMIAAIDI
jgi:hypothetical protein